MVSGTVKALRSMSAGDLRRKLLQRVRHPRLIAGDLRRIYVNLRADGVRLYAAYHRMRNSHGRVYSIKRRNCCMWLPISWGDTVALRRFGLFEPLIFDTLSQLVHPGFIAVELGSCYGAFTIHLSRLVGPTGRVYAFEPFPKYFVITKRNIQLNGLSNVRLVNQAVGPASVQQVEFDAEATNPYSSLHQISGLDYSMRTGTFESTAGPAVTIPCVSLLDFLQREQCMMDLLFMDIEGCEIAVLKDIRSLLAGQKRPVVFFELHRGFYRAGDQEWLEGFFANCGYSTEIVGNHLLCVPLDMPVPQSAAGLRME